MNIQRFLNHHGLKENPFDAEEARHDPVFDRLLDAAPGHPDFAKIMGRIDHPGTAVVFGEKGSGKTAIRMMIARRVAEHNAQHPKQKTLLVAYDDLNPVLDRIMQRRRHELGFRRIARATNEQLLGGIRLQDHQDAILSLAVTQVVDGMLNARDRDSDQPTAAAAPLPMDVKALRRHQRVDLAVLAALYDQPRHGPLAQRWRKLRQKLRLGWIPPMSIMRLGAIVFTVAGVGLAVWRRITSEPAGWMLPIAGVLIAAAAVLWAVWLWRHVTLWRLCRKIRHEMSAVDRSVADLRMMLMELRRADRGAQPWPLADSRDSRYQLTARLLGVLEALGYQGMMVLVDRVDEPSVVSGKPERMRPIVWPFFDSKFLQQSQVGVKLLLPIELRHMLHRESPDFFQEARLDKQNLIDRLTWSGATLYDLCTTRLRACRNTPPPEVESPESKPLEERPAPRDGMDVMMSDAGDDLLAQPAPRSATDADGQITLTDLFDPSVSRQVLVDALDQMQQPRDAFKFLYSLVMEHCRSVPDDEPSYRIPRLTLESVRRQQAQRVQDLYRGVSPA